MKRFYFVVCFILLITVVSSGYTQDKKLSVSECIEIALKQNPDIIMSEFSLKIAGKDVVVSISSFLPQISGELGYYHSVKGPSSELMIDPRTGIPIQIQPDEIESWASRAGISVNQTVFNGGYNIFNIKQSLALKKSAGYGLKATKQNIFYIVKERYYNLLKAEKLLGVAEETLKSSEQSYKRARILYEVGKGDKSDVLQAKVQLENDRLSLIEAQNSLSIARASLNHVLGFNVDNKINVVDDLELTEIEIKYKDALNNAYQYNPNLLKSKFDLKASKASVGMAASSYLPSLSAYYSYSWNHKDFNEINNLLDKDYNWYMGVSLSIPIFQGMSRFAQLSKAKLNKMAQNEKLEQVKRDIALESKQAYFNVEQAKKKIAVTRNAVEAAEEGLRLNKEKYNIGSGTMLDLINAQVSYTQAKSNNIQSLYDYKYAVARLQKAMGLLIK